MNLSDVFCSKRLDSSKHEFLIKGFNLILLFFLISFICVFLFSSQIYEWNTVLAYKTVFVSGWIKTGVLSVISLLLSVVIGLITALMGKSTVRLIRYLALFYVEIIRGTPLLVQLLAFFYVVGTALDINSRLLIGVLTLSLFSGAYIAELIRSCIDSVQKSHLDSAKAIGMTPLQTYRFIILPMMMRQILPPLAGQFASIIKDSSLLSILGIREFTYSAQQISSATYSTLESYFPLAVGYLILTLPISILSKTLEKRFKYES